VWGEGEDGGLDECGCASGVPRVVR
jgi:hypothetical protein